VALLCFKQYANDNIHVWKLNKLESAEVVTENLSETPPPDSRQSDGENDVNQKEEKVIEKKQEKASNKKKKLPEQTVESVNQAVAARWRRFGFSHMGRKLHRKNRKLTGKSSTKKKK